jgi:hypothetical protein
MASFIAIPAKYGSKSLLSSGGCFLLFPPFDSDGSFCDDPLTETFFAIAKPAIADRIGNPASAEIVLVRSKIAIKLRLSEKSLFLPFGAKF